MPDENPPPGQLQESVLADLRGHAGEFDAIVCGFDPHGATLGALAAAALNKPLLIVCGQHNSCSISHIVAIGDVDPESRFCYIDDYAQFGGTKDTVFQYMCSSETPNIVACYMATKKRYTRGSFITSERGTRWVSQ